MGTITTQYHAAFPLALSGLPQPSIEAAARKHGVPYLRSPTIIAAFVKLWEHLIGMAVRPEGAAPAAAAGGARKKKAL